MKNRFKVILVDGISGGRPVDVEEEIAALAGLDAEFKLDDCKSEDDVISRAKDADVILTFGAPMTRRVMEKLPKCRAIVRYGIGYDTVDVEAATDNGIMLINIPDFCFEEVSNHALALLLACAKKITILNELVKKGDWNGAKNAQPPMVAIHGQTMGIIGCGNIGRTTARKARCFGMKIIGYDPYVEAYLAEEAGIELVTLDELLKNSDFVSLHTALSKETHHLIGEPQLKLMKPSAYIINTSRGPVIDEPALIKALQKKKIAGAGLDVFEKEPVSPDNPLLKMDNVIVLPHSASYSDAAFRRLHQCVGREAARVISGKRPLNIVNKNVRPKTAPGA